MIKCISYWSTPKGLENTEPIESACAMTKAAGFDGIELCIATDGVLTTATSQADCQAIRKTVDGTGLVCETLASGMSWGCNPTSEDAQVRERAIELTEQALQRAAWLGCSAFLFVPGVVNSPIAPEEHVRYDHAVQRVREAVERLLETAERVGVDLCLENVWNGLFLSPLEFSQFVDDFKSKRLGIYFDVGNVLGYHQRPDHWVQLLGERIKRVHIKGFRESFGFSGNYEFCKLLEGDVPWQPTMAALKQIGYDRTVVAELMPYDDHLFAQTSDAMDRILGMF